MDQRTQDILKILINDGSHHTFKDIARKLDVSVRTIARSMKAVYTFCEAQQISVTHQRGIGISINLNPNQKSEISYLLENGNVKELYSPTDRMIIIVTELLTAKEPIKSYYFASILKVTSATISRDLVEVKKWFKKSFLTLNINRGNGIWITGDTDEIKAAKVNLLLSNIDKKRFYYWSGDSEFWEIFDESLALYTRKRLSNLVNSYELLEVIRIIDEYDFGLKQKLVDAYYIRWIILITLTIERIGVQTEDSPQVQEMVSNNEVVFQYILDLMELIEGRFNISIGERHVIDIYNNYVSSKVRDIQSVEQVDLNDKPMKITLSLIEAIQSDLDVQLVEDQDLVHRLNLHLKLLLMRKDMRINVNESIIDTIKSNYEYIFSVVKRHSINLFQGTNTLDDEEIGYITLHITAAIMNIKNKVQVVKAVVVCMSGMGTSKMLIERIKQKIKSVEIVDTIAFHEVNELSLMSQGIDLIISTIYLETLLLPAVIIEPLLSVDDIKEVNTQITLLKERKTGHIKLGFEEKSKQDNKEEINSNNNTLFYFGLINQILNEFIFETDLIAHDMQGLIEYVSKLPTKSKATQDKVLNELMKRETYGSTFIDQAGLLLLHCKAEQLTSLGIVRLDKPTEFKVGGTPQKVRAALLMIVPEHADERLVDLFGAISKNVVLDSDLLFTMITRPKEEILNKISNVFSQFIK